MCVWSGFSDGGVWLAGERGSGGGRARETNVAIGDRSDGAMERRMTYGVHTCIQGGYMLYLVHTMYS